MHNGYGTIIVWSNDWGEGNEGNVMMILEPGIASEEGGTTIERTEMKRTVSETKVIGEPGQFKELQWDGAHIIM